MYISRGLGLLFAYKTGRNTPSAPKWVRCTRFAVSCHPSGLSAPTLCGPAHRSRAAKDWQAPDASKLPDDMYGQMVRHGKALMEETYKHIGPEVKDVRMRYAGNNLACVSCHMDAGGRKFGNPWVGTLKLMPLARAADAAAGKLVYTATCVACPWRSTSSKAICPAASRTSMPGFSAEQHKYGPWQPFRHYFWAMRQEQPQWTGPPPASPARPCSSPAWRDSRRSRRRGCVRGRPSWHRR